MYGSAGYRAKGQAATWQMLMGPLLILLVSALMFVKRWHTADIGYMGMPSERFWGFLKHETGAKQGGVFWHQYRVEMCLRHERLNFFFALCVSPICRHYLLKCILYT